MGHAAPVGVSEKVEESHPQGCYLPPRTHIRAMARNGKSPEPPKPVQSKKDDGHPCQLCGDPMYEDRTTCELCRNGCAPDLD